LPPHSLSEKYIGLVIVRFLFGFSTVAQALTLNELIVQIEEEERKVKKYPLPILREDLVILWAAC
jgi:hypothetical protein